MFTYLLSSDAVEIDAPIERAWDILMDVQRYGEWNPFTPRVATDFEIGSRVDLRAMIGPVPLKQLERIELVEPPGRLVWTTRIGHRALLFARREQRLEALGGSRCRYVTTDAFSGLLTPLVVLLFGGLVRRGFNGGTGPESAGGVRRPTGRLASG
ncbi:SRPBCC domain-containing protein [Candidatus Palauibacter sp.]|uniref:SRPBCC domain-containing protein n=1 Tax=Candidatus Palauibacter sp. TaxID=3101350 RepID=UPI003B023B99